MTTMTAKTHEHTVQFYKNDNELILSIRKFIVQGDTAIVIARRSLEKAIKKDLDYTGKLLFLDAAETLAEFMVNGMPHPQLFERTIGSLMSELTKHEKNVFAFGEMVALLWDDGNAAGAIMLEEMWNDLQYSYPFALLCAYPIRNFNNNVQAARFSYMCSCHSNIIPPDIRISIEKKLRKPKVHPLEMSM